MTWELYAAYLLASAVVLAIPGPTVLLVIAYALNEGRRAAWPTIAGVGLGDFVAMSVSLAGLGAVLAASAELFNLLKWAGAAYLVWLGVQIWRAKPAPAEAPPAQRKPAAAMFRHAFVVTALNPKGIAFFVAFLPQFVVPQQPAPPQLALLGMTFVLLGVLNAALYAMLAGSLRGLVRRPGALALFNRAGGTALIGAGVATAMLRRPS